jgi:hypothetical protein
MLAMSGQHVGVLTVLKNALMVTVTVSGKAAKVKVKNNES